MRKIFSVIIFLCTTISFSQNVTIKGKITDNDNFPLESATIYLTSVKDSTVIDYTISNKNGVWELNTRRLSQPFHLKVSYVGLADHKEEFTALEEDRDFGTIKLGDISTELNEVVIESEIPPIRIKSDTLEFNASSFKVRPDANVETLIKQLPGVDIDEEGKITVNGKEVNQILVNGKPFFDKDGKIALQNLPAEIINKVQVTDTKTKKEELSGQAASGNNASINLTIDEDKNKGYFARMMGGYGTDKRYEASGLINYFKGNRKISVLASSNNINASGFSMNEIFDSMGGGRNNSFYPGYNGGIGINGMRFGGGNGITRTNILGLTYSDEWFKGFDPNFNYFYTSADNENNSKSRSETFLPDDNNSNAPDSTIQKKLISESSSRTDEFKYAHNLNTDFEFKIDSTSSVYFAPRIIKANSKSSSTAQGTTRNQDGNLLNENSGSTFDESDNAEFGTELTYNKIFNKRGRSVSLTFNSENTLEDAAEYNNSATYLYDDVNNDGIVETTADIRNQLRKNRQTRDEYEGEIEYNEPLKDSLNLRIGLEYALKQSVDDRDGFNFNEVTGTFSERNELITNYLSSNESRVNPSAGINIQKSKYSLTLMGGTSIINFRNYGAYMGEDYRVNKNYMLPTVNGHFRYRLTKAQSVYINYNYDVTLPRPEQILPIEDRSRPLYTIIGNANLNPNKTHRTYMGLNSYDFATKSGYNIYAGAGFDESAIVDYTTIEDNARQTTSYRNVSGTFNSWFGGSWNKMIKTDGAHKYRLNLGLNGGYDISKGFVNEQRYEAEGYRINPKIGLTYEYGELLTINPIYSFTYNEIHYNNYNTSFTSNFTHKLGLQTTSYWPKNIVFGNDFNYTYNSNLGRGFKKDFFLWNTSLGYNFLNDNLMFKVKVYDVLNQNLATSRYITPTGIYDSQNTVLKRYMMFSLTVKFDKFGKKRRPETSENRFWWF